MILFASKFTEDEVKAISLEHPQDLAQHLVDIKDNQLRAVCEKIYHNESFKPLCCMTKIKGDDDLSKCKFYFVLTELLIKEYNSGADFKFRLGGGINYGRVDLKYADGTMVEIYPFSSYGLSMYRIMRYGIINTDPVLKNKYIFERVWENKESYLLKPKLLVKGLQKL